MIEIQEKVVNISIFLHDQKKKSITINYCMGYCTGKSTVIKVNKNKLYNNAHNSKTIKMPDNALL